MNNNKNWKWPKCKCGKRIEQSEVGKIGAKICLQCEVDHALAEEEKRKAEGG
jgi:hypothetical protein